MHPTFMLYDKYLDQNYSEVKRCAYPYIRICDWQHTHPQRNINGRSIASHTDSRFEFIESKEKANLS